MISIAILGASGYGGNELINILVKHPKVTIKYIQSRTNIAKKVSEIYPDSNIHLVYTNPSIQEINACDMVFLALPKEEAVTIAQELKTNVIDLSPAHRFNKKYVYGLPEVERKKIKEARFIANPGCYATACILGSLPLTKNKKYNIKIGRAHV